VENLRKDSLVSQRIMFNAIQNAGDVMSVNIDKRMLLFVRSARSRWKKALKSNGDGCKNKDNEAATQKRVASEIKAFFYDVCLRFVKNGQSIYKTDTITLFHCLI